MEWYYAAPSKPPKISYRQRLTESLVGVTQITVVQKGVPLLLAWRSGVP